MKWTDEEIEKTIKDLMEKLNIKRMPTSIEMRDNKLSGLSRAISSNEGMYHWAKKLDLPMKQRERLWGSQRIKEHLKRSIDILQIDRMPTASELHSIGRGDLHNAISRSEMKYKGWSKKLELELKLSETTIGQKYETLAKNMFVEKGYSVSKMSTKFPYDLLVNGSLKVDVKSAKVHRNFGEKYYTFGINKEVPTCDLYLLFALGEKENEKNLLIVPSHFVKVKTLTFRDNNKKWLRFKDKWGYVEQYLGFFESVQQA